MPCFNLSTSPVAAGHLTVSASHAPDAVVVPRSFRTQQRQEKHVNNFLNKLLRNVVSSLVLDYILFEDTMSQLVDRETIVTTTLGYTLGRVSE